MKFNEVFLKQLNINVETHFQLESLLPEIEKAISTVHKKIKLGGKLMLCGNTNNQISHERPKKQNSNSIINDFKQ